MNKHLIIAATCIGLLSGCHAQNDKSTTVNEQTLKTEKQMEDLKLLAEKGQNAFFRDYNEQELRKYFSEDYIQHNPYTPTGLEPIVNFLPALKQAGTTFETHRMIQDGDFIVAHNSYDNAEAFGAKVMIAFDIYRFEDGKVVEHWDGLTPQVTETASGRSQVDGPTKVVDLDKTDANKALIKNFMNDIMMGANPSKITDYISTETYHQHNTAIKDGLEGLNEAIEYLASENNMFTYEKVHKILGEGNFVLTQSEGTWNGGKKYAFYDLFRIANGKIVEHWDIIQEVPTEMPHTNGMF